jgi:hypothetical protein
VPLPEVPNKPAPVAAKELTVDNKDQNKDLKAQSENEQKLTVS